MLLTKSPRRPSSKDTQSIGAHAEQRALDYLIQQGLTFEAKNVTAKVGEIDIVMHDKNTIVFVEVRYRRASQYGGAAASVTPAKQKKIQSTAQHYMQQKNLFEKHAMRFDVIAIDGDTLSWIKGAF